MGKLVGLGYWKIKVMLPTVNGPLLTLDSFGNIFRI